MSCGGCQNKENELPAEVYLDGVPQNQPFRTRRRVFVTLSRPYSNLKIVSELSCFSKVRTRPSHQAGFPRSSQRLGIVAAKRKRDRLGVVDRSLPIQFPVISRLARLKETDFTDLVQRFHMTFQFFDGGSRARDR